jgi:ribosomal protein S6
MKNYELACLIPANLSDIEVESSREKIIELLQKEQAILFENPKNKPVRKKLGYPVKKTGQAFLLTFNFQMNPAGLAELEKELKADQEIIRYSIFAKKMLKPEKAARRPVGTKKKIAHPKVELKEIEKKLDEILGQ